LAHVKPPVLAALPFRSCQPAGNPKTTSIIICGDGEVPALCPKPDSIFLAQVAACCLASATALAPEQESITLIAYDEAGTTEQRDSYEPSQYRPVDQMTLPQSD